MSNEAGPRKPESTWVPIIILASVMLAAFGHGGCRKSGGGGGAGAGNGGTGGPPQLTQIFLNSNSVINIMVGSSITLTATGSWSDGGTQPEPVTFALTPPTGIASLPGPYTLHGDALGQATLVATSIATPSITRSVL